MSTTGSIAELAPTFTGQLLAAVRQRDTTKPAACTTGLIDKRPALIARCFGTADVADAVKLARSLNLEVAVRGGGHNVAGRATIDGGVMIDLAPMKGIYVDPVARTVRAQGGVLWKELNRETQLHGLATTGGVVGTTGIAGLTLGGGLGWLMPKYGLALDNLRSAELVMADGRVDARQRRIRTPTCSGRSAAAAATSASPRRSSTTFITVGTDHHRRPRRRTRCKRLATCSNSSANSARRHRTS